jgi:hypothetical protein
MTTCAEVMPDANGARGKPPLPGCGWTTKPAAVLMIGHGLEPLEPYPGAGRQWRCRCLRRGAEVAPRYSNIQQGWGGCPACRRAASSARQRGPEAEAIEVLRAAGLEPLEPYQGVMMPWQSQCRTCGNQAAPLLNNIKKG